MEDDDLADGRVGEVRPDPVDQYALVDAERGLHRPAGNPVRLDDERLDQEGQAERCRHNHHGSINELESDFFVAVTRCLRRQPPRRPPDRRPCGAVEDADTSRLLGAGLLSGRGFVPRPPRRRRSRPRLLPRARPPRRRGSHRLPGGLVAVVLGPVQELALDGLLGTGVATLADAGALAHPAAQVVELGPPHVPARGHLDPLDLRRVQRERPLDADAERLLADRERLAGAVALTLDHDPLEHLGPPPGPFDHLKVDANTVAGVERRYSAELCALQGFDDGGHGNESAAPTIAAWGAAHFKRMPRPAGGLW